MKLFNYIFCTVNFALVMVWSYTDRAEMAVLNGVASILCAIWATHPADLPRDSDK